MQSQSTSSAHWPRSLQATGNPLVASARFMEDLTIGSLFLPVDLALSRLSSFSSIKVQADKRMLLSTPQRTAYASRDEKKRTFEERIASAFHEDGRVEVVALRAAVNSTEPRRFLDFATAYLRNELSPEAIMAFKASIAEQGGFVKFKTIPAGAATDRSLRNRSVYSDQARVYYLSTDDRKELVRIGLETVKILGKFEGREVQQNALFDAVVPGRAGISFDNYQTQYRG
ncbi:MAG: hypothetical protein KDD62_16010, partial [Bdellovibrionales bacterium]|nr:hypothetical protein [Bdellovibrionales bacterium]